MVVLFCWHNVMGHSRFTEQVGQCVVCRNGTCLDTNAKRREVMQYNLSVVGYRGSIQNTDP